MIDNGNREDETNDNQQSMLLGNADLYEHSFISSDSNRSECEVNSTTNSSSTGIENVSSLQHAWFENESLMLYTNADYLMNKRDELKTLISINKYDIVVISEVLPKNRTSCTISETKFHINGYRMFNTELSSDKGRGIITYVKTEIKATALNLPNFQHIEATEIKIKLRNSDWLFLIAVYRSPNSNVDCLIELEYILSYDKEGHIKASYRVIMGDFNLREINWDTETSNVNENHLDTKFLEGVRDNFLFQHVKQATRMRDNQQDSILDLILTNEENMIDNVKYLPPLGKSDHVTIQFSFITYINIFRSRTEKLNFFKGDYEKIRTNLKDINWEDKITETMDLQESWESFTDLINHEVKNNIPVCKAFNKT